MESTPRKRLNCEEVLSQLSDFLDADAREALCLAIQEHLHACHDCQLEVDTLKKTIMLYQAERPIELPSGVSDQLRVALSKVYGEPGGSKS
ncbi:MAG: zf-HC2 domain-containing protein [Candidatus Eisenbacteria bacterium]|uniref:Zf-HC2 domain-containing protein n=1 Tax=Eiseniibacteriota bacterium TaxID=2212470 RepID=A0A849SIF0_UNCEI|nr:zf-HC2 domain-containing protein [Candidatus Eisenbacteria bacterium]